MEVIKFIDLFAGLGGTRIGFEQACIDKGNTPMCVFTSEIKDSAIEAYKNNFFDDNIHGDITKISPDEIPDFDYLLGGFPCQPFSSAGSRKGFLDRRGGLFFVIIDILKSKKPKGFLLENVEGLTNHDKGKTITVMLEKLKELGYNTTARLLDASEFGVPQKRKRVYIVGHLDFTPTLDNFLVIRKTTGECLDYGLSFIPSEFSRKLFEKFTPTELEGKSIKDKRGGNNNIHSWDLELKGSVSNEQKELLSLILKKRRSKSWAKDKGISWMDGMPLTLNEIKTFYSSDNLIDMLNDLVQKGYLTLEHPKEKVNIDGVEKRVQNKNLPKGYNIVAGKLSFPISHILDPNSVCPTIVATEAGKIGVVTKLGVRPISINEGLLLSGFPQNYSLDGLTYNRGFDLIGNTVMPPVIKEVAKRLIP